MDIWCVCGEPSVVVGIDVPKDICMYWRRSLGGLAGVESWVGWKNQVGCICL